MRTSAAAASWAPPPTAGPPTAAITGPGLVIMTSQHSYKRPDTTARSASATVRSAPAQNIRGSVLPSTTGSTWSSARASRRARASPTSRALCRCGRDNSSRRYPAGLRSTRRWGCGMRGSPRGQPDILKYGIPNERGLAVEAGRWRVRPAPLTRAATQAGTGTTAPDGSGTTAPGGSGTTAPGGSGTAAPGGSGTTALGGSGTAAPGKPGTAAPGGSGTTALGGSGTAAPGKPGTAAPGGPGTGAP